MPPSSSISGFNFQKLFIVQCVRNEDSQESRERSEIGGRSHGDAFGDNKSSLPRTGPDQLYYTILLVRGAFFTCDRGRWSDKKKGKRDYCPSPSYFCCFEIAKR